MDADTINAQVEAVSIRYTKGDISLEIAFCEMFGLVQAPVCATLRSEFWSATDEDVKDWYQTLMLSVYRWMACPGRQFPVPILPFLKAAARRIKISAWRKKQCRRNVDGPLPKTQSAEELKDLIPCCLDHSKAYEVRDALGKLASPARELLILRFLDGLTLAEIGERLGATESCVKTRLSKAKEQFRSVFRDPPDGPTSPTSTNAPDGPLQPPASSLDALLEIFDDDAMLNLLFASYDETGEIMQEEAEVVPPSFFAVLLAERPVTEKDAPLARYTAQENAPPSCLELSSRYRYLKGYSRLGWDSARAATADIPFIEPSQIEAHLPLGHTVIRVGSITLGIRYTANAVVVEEISGFFSELRAAGTFIVVPDRSVRKKTTTSLITGAPGSLLSYWKQLEKAIAGVTHFSGTASAFNFVSNVVRWGRTVVNSHQLLLQNWKRDVDIERAPCSRIWNLQRDARGARVPPPATGCCSFGSRGEPTDLLRLLKDRRMPLTDGERVLSGVRERSGAVASVRRINPLLRVVRECGLCSPQYSLTTTADVIPWARQTVTVERLRVFHNDSTYDASAWVALNGRPEALSMLPFGVLMTGLPRVSATRTPLVLLSAQETTDVSPYRGVGVWRPLAQSPPAHVNVSTAQFMSRGVGQPLDHNAHPSRMI